MFKRKSRSLVNRGCDRYDVAMPPISAYDTLECARAPTACVNAWCRSAAAIGESLAILREQLLLKPLPFCFLSHPALLDGRSPRGRMHHAQTKFHETRDLLEACIRRQPAK